MEVAQEVLLLFGGNEGDPRSTFDRAEKAIKTRIGKILSVSRDHWTEPWGFNDDRFFLNKALIVRTELAPAEILAQCLSIERDLGRTRHAGSRNSSRPIDLDILLIGDMVLAEGDLQVPHPRMQMRHFALAPSADIAPEWVHPVFGRTVLQLLAGLPPLVRSPQVVKNP